MSTEHASPEYSKSALEPTTVPAFEAISSPEELVEWSRHYARLVVAETDLDIDLRRVVEWTVASEMKRHPAAVTGITHEDFETGVPFEKEDYQHLVVYVRGNEDFSAFGQSKMCLSWLAFKEYSEAEWKELIRHELIHVEQFQRYGATNHGDEFQERADDLDTRLCFRKFADAQYALHCSNCDQFIGDCYQETEAVENPADYKSSCCNAALTIEANPDD